MSLYYITEDSETTIHTVENQTVPRQQKMKSCNNGKYLLFCLAVLAVFLAVILC